ncbi:RepB family plasmid replication initiator protein [Priestia megaterium]|uniref:RepB family plasmid replication initiator protein n=1 Tax=Priestia megaterium TaxID=1404 RepID=A0ABD4WLQ8_PRIMG|nr:RepB family plasmid replication initiator protein [Priestia megaterium]MDD9781150.1 RepB family plasmid replication initiator protein [Priestia megaterium]MED3855166.1 RepB family plasmid replication initiator protein [Priestia megaterium]MED4794622.1 RepB family plasmid replication initiator protein [Priestia megaterium]PEB66690.1 replication initiation protein [Priestia megaterium]
MKKTTVVQPYDLESINIKNWVTKSNILIESTYKLSLQEQRILLIMASKVQPNDETLKTYRFRAKDFIEIVGNKKGTGFYSYLKEIVNGLQTKILTIKEKGKQRNYNWVITSIYEENEGYITLQFHPSLKYLFLELKEKFTSYQLENVVRLNSVYSIRIYELLKQYERLRKRELTLEELRHFLAIEPTKYKQYGHFKSKVLAVAQKEINNKTDIRFEFVELKTGRKVTSIEFIITSSPAMNEANAAKEKKLESNQELLKLEDNKNSIQNDLENLGVKPEKIEWLLSEFTKEHLERNIKYTQDRSVTGEVTYPHSYVVKAIQKDYAKLSQESKRINSKKTPKKELVPDFIAEARDKQQSFKGFTLKEQQELFFKENGTQIEFEEQLLQFQELKKMLVLSSDQPSQQEVKKAQEAGLQEVIRNMSDDLKKREELGLEPRLVSDFKNKELKKVYKEFLQSKISNKT